MIEKRLQKFLAKFDELNIDAALVYKDENRNYLSGFTGDDSFLFITKEKSYFITDSRYTEQAQNEVVGFEVLEYKPPIHDFIKSLVEKHNVKRLGVEEDRMSLSDYITYKEKLEGVEIVKLEQTIEKIRMIKDDEEIKLIETAASIADKAFEHILKFIKPGISEREVALEIEFFMKKMGASALSFPTIVASGTRSSLPHGTASDKIIQEGEFITLDFGCVYKGYCSDMTRTIVLGKANEKQKEIYNIVLEANEAALKAVRPGISCVELDKIARDIIVEKGYGDRFGHGLGHGVGREVHELPFVNARSKFNLEPGMIITDEPGIYIPGFGGVRIEELVLVTEDGYRVLSKSPKHLIEL
ncbi:M24 family metallopeptidase [Thermobrachium celere]|uniref:Aminopeptidase YpdF (MP-, MA-, MS-, AP-, NP-specific) n=1 Tax=Thermobrachium celere DSM 8682 TaxID=941824 RepID=R7RS55_9CLOT|nr:Xaa-Pro peptidase family protein [Thermobrachium celere]CDF58221.1 Aminopeptidase YpdF (MP-, MA-, MS-, AP-, NP-specific) [Thermobrachium celere DSM 8682]